MAKRQKTTAFSFQGYDLDHYRTTDAYTRAVGNLFDRATNDIATGVAKLNIDPDKPFQFSDYPSAQATLKRVVNKLAKNMTAVVSEGSRKQWLYACHKNDEFISSIIDTSKLTRARLQKMQDRNLDALQTFQQRKVNGMNLSQRVWKYVGQFKDQIEQGLDVGLGDGRNAQQLSQDLKQNLKDPNRLYRRVRDKRGNLQLSKNAKAFHPGQGVYRSSHKNAMRLTRSEINMAYRESDWLRWQQLDFVIGFEVHRSNHEPRCKCDLCEKLVGRYPKTFKFKGWHPQCMCYATAILMDEDDYDAQELSDLKSALRGTEYKKLEVKNTVNDVPQGFKDWVAANQEAQAGWGSTPYFIKDNFKDGLLKNGLKQTSISVAKEVYEPHTYTSGGIVETPTVGSQTKVEANKNLKAATEMAKYHGRKIRLLPCNPNNPNPQPDAMDIESGKSIEIKVPQPSTNSAKNSIQSAIKESSRQGVKEIIIYFNTFVSMQSVYRGLIAALQGKRGDKIETVTIRFADGEIKTFDVKKLKEWLHKKG